MKYVFTGFLILLLALSGAAWWLKPSGLHGGKVVLVWTSDDNPARREQIGLFNRLHPKHHLRLDPANVDMQKVIVQSLAGVGPDLFDSYTVFQTSAYIRSGIAWDITEEMATHGIDVPLAIWPALHPYVVHEGRIYGFPRNAAADAVLFNKRIFEECKITFPKGLLKPEEFLSLARQLTVRDESGRVKHFGFLFDWWQWAHFLRGWDGRIFTDDGARCALDSPEAIACTQFLQDLIWKHNVTPTPEQEAAMATAGGWGSGNITWFGGGRGAMALGGRWWLCRLRDRRDFPDLRTGVVECQFGPRRQYRGYGGGVMINKNSPKREQALDFLLYMAGREYNELINHQADAVGPVKKHTYSEAFLHDPAYPEEDSNDVWREAMERGLPEEQSPFVNGAVVNRIISTQLDLVKRNEKNAADAMKRAAVEINAEIEKMLEQDPSLRARYEAVRKGSLLNGKPE